MAKFQGSGKTEDEILKYLAKNTKKQPSKINLSLFRIDSIAKELDLSAVEVGDVLDSLKDKKVIGLKLHQTIFLPLNSDGKRIKKYLVEQKLWKGSYHLFISLLLFVGFYWVLSNLVQVTYQNIPIALGPLILGGIMLWISYSLGGYISVSWEHGLNIIENSKMKYLIFLLLFGIIITPISYYFIWDRIITIIAGMVTIISFIVLVVEYLKKRD